MTAALSCSTSAAAIGRIGSRAGELLFARQGSLFRVRVDKRNSLDRPEQLIDLGSLKFEPAPAPPEAMRWGGEPVSGKLLPVSRRS